MKRHASMNRCYRLVWNQIHNTWIAVAENVRARGKSAARRAQLAAALLLLAPLAYAAPTGGVVSAGTGIIAQAGTNTTITQQSQQLAIDWSSFSVAANEAVKFNQPSASAIALNRVLGVNGSEILGTLSANGQVFILNPNGVLFGPGAQVTVGGLVASTLSLSNADFVAGNYAFSNNGATGAVVNQGGLTAANGGYVALLGNNVGNQGVITATLGTALLAAGDKVTLNLNNGSLVGYSIDQGALDALAENSQLVQADGGLVVMTAAAADAVSKAAVNNSGIIEAHTVQNQGGVIKLLGDMQVGQVNVSGTLDASAPNGGNGGAVETSAAGVKVTDTAQVTTAAPQGTSGTWLIDPADISIGTDISAAALAASLDGGNVTIQTGNTGAGNGDIFVDAAVSWSSANLLTLNAFRNIEVNAPVSNSAGGSLVLYAGRSGWGTGTVIANNGATVTLGGGGRADLYYNPTSYLTPTDYAALMGATPHTAWMLVNNVAQLFAMRTNLAGAYALNNDIDALHYTGFSPVGFTSAPFTGQFDGLNHSISNLTINLPQTNYVGLFGYTGSGSVVRNVMLIGGGVTGGNYVGSLVGFNGGSVSNVSSTASVMGYGGYYVGGLVGANSGISASVTNAHAGSTVNGFAAVGGLVGQNLGGAIAASSASGAVTGRSGGTSVGGLIGDNRGSIAGAQASGAVSGDAEVGGLVGLNLGAISDAAASGSVGGTNWVGGLAGRNQGSIKLSYASGDVNGSGAIGVIGGLAGENSGSIDTAYASGNVTGGPSSNIVGGLIGDNLGSVSNAYATGAVTGNLDVGGLAGRNYPGGSIANAYARGAVSGNGRVGGLVGSSTLQGTASNVYWDMQTSGQGAATGNGPSTGMTGLTTAQMQAMASFAGWDIASSGGGNAVWRIYEGNSYPLLRTFLTPLTVTANDAAKTYDGLAYSGGNGMTFSVVPNANLLGTPGYGGTSQAAVNAGSYTITPGGYYSNQQGYDITFIDGTLTVNPAALTVTANNAAKTYDGLAYSGGNGVTYSGFVNGETAAVLGGTLTYGGSAQGAVNAGNYDITPGGLSGGNYMISYANGALAVNPAALTVTANNAARTYDGLAYSGGNGVTYSGFVNGETAAVLGGTLAYGGTSQGAVNAGSYAITPGGLTSGNYAISYASGALSVNPAALIVTANDATKVYDGKPYSGGNGATYSGFVNGETAAVLGGTLAYGGTSQGAINSGSYVITPGGLSSGNYTISYVDGTLTIGYGMLKLVPLILTPLVLTPLPPLTPLILDPLMVTPL